MHTPTNLQSWWSRGGVMPAVRPESASYFFGKITREQAEEFLAPRANTEGLFLLRESVGGNFAMSICHKGRVHHYNVERIPEGGYRIPGGPKFPGPIELVMHHAEHLDGVLTLARYPLERTGGPENIIALQGDITVGQFEELLRVKALEVGLRGRGVEDAVNGPMRDHLRQLVLTELHFTRPWYHDDIRRKEAEKRLAVAANSVTNPVLHDGIFLIRYRPEDDSYVLSLWYQKEPKHYKIERRMSKLFIEGGKLFDSVIEMIDHYHFRQDGLLCKLRRGVEAPGRSSSNSRSGGSGSLSSRSSLTGGTSSPSHGFFNSNMVDTSSMNSPCNSVSQQMSQLASGKFPSRNSQDSLPGCSSPRLHSASSHSSPMTLQGGSTLNVSLSSGGLINSSSGASSIASSCLSGTSPSSQQGAIPIQQSNRSSQSQSRQSPHTVSMSPSNCPWTGQNNLSNNRTATTAPLPSVPPIQPTQNLSKDLDTISNDLISFADWPHVTALLNQTTNDGIPNQQPEQQRPSSQPSPQHQPFTINQHALMQLIGNTRGTNPPFGFTPSSTSPFFSDPDTTPTPGMQVFAPNWSLPTATFGPNVPISHPPVAPGTSPFSSTPFNTPPHPSFTSSVFAPALNASQQQTNPPMGSRTQQLQQQANILADLFAPGAGGVSQAFSQLDSLIKTPLTQTSVLSNSVMEQVWEEPDSKASDVQSISSLSTASSTDNYKDEDDTQKIYDAVPMNEITFNIRVDQLVMKEKLGGGNFGQVTKAIYRTSENGEVPVAVKMLRQDTANSFAFQASEREILQEARTMSQLRHRYIVRLLGVCQDKQVMLVMELAPLGPINKYLKRFPENMPVNTIIELSYQVAQGMAYLENCKFVHRDLAARNVLLVNQQYAKISDFGMSKALQVGNDYYRAAAAGKWPLKWYAPECIYYFRFDTKSDVWSFGVTLWEMFSYGERPYKDLKGTQILAMLDQGLRLTKPPKAPDSIYDLMHQCWRFEGVRRPTFAELVLSLSRILCQVSGSPALAAPPNDLKQGTTVKSTSAAP